MASKIDVPITGDSVDPTDPVGSLKTVGMLILGFTVLMVAFAFGSDLATNIQNLLADLTGFDAGDGTSIEVI